VSWLNLLPKELEPGDHWDDGQVVDSVEPVESAMNCRIVFTDDTSIIWPWEAPRRVYRP
jgi:hypothetical protein